MKSSKAINTFNKKVGENIEQIRTKQKKAIKDMAALLGLTDCGYRNIERGITVLTLSKLTKIANFLSVPYCEILTTGNKKCSFSIANRTPLISPLEKLYKQRMKDLKDENGYLKKQIDFLNEIISKNKLK